MARKKAYIKVPKPNKKKDVLDNIRKKDTMKIINEMKEKKEKKEKNEKKTGYSELLVRTLCYILKLYTFDTHVTASKVDAFEKWFYNKITILIDAAKIKNNILIFTLFNIKLKGLIEKIDYDLQHEMYIDEEIDVIFKMKEKLNIFISLNDKIIKNNDTIDQREKDIITIISETGTTRENAIMALENNRDDLVSAIMEIML